MHVSSRNTSEGSQTIESRVKNNDSEKVMGEVIDKEFDKGELSPSTYIPADLKLTVDGNDSYIREYYYKNDSIAKKNNKKYHIGTKCFLPKKGNGVKQITFTKEYLNPDEKIRDKVNVNKSDLVKGEILDFNFDKGELSPRTYIPADLKLTVKCEDGHTREQHIANDFVAKKAFEIYKKGVKIYLPRKHTHNVKIID